MIQLDFCSSFSPALILAISVSKAVLERVTETASSAGASSARRAMFYLWLLETSRSPRALRASLGAPIPAAEPSIGAPLLPPHTSCHLWRCTAVPPHPFPPKERLGEGVKN